MLAVSLAVLNALARGARPAWRVTVHWQQPETYMEADRLLGVGDLSMRLSHEGSYELAHTTVTLKNEQALFSRRLARELPNRKLVEMALAIAGEPVLLFRGIVGQWTLTPTTLQLQIHA